MNSLLAFFQQIYAYLCRKTDPIDDNFHHSFYFGGIFRDFIWILDFHCRILSKFAIDNNVSGDCHNGLTKGLNEERNFNILYIE